MKTKLFLIGIFSATRLFAGLGDLNNDGSITLDDCKLLAAQVASGVELIDLTVSDIDGNGTVSIVDADVHVVPLPGSLHLL